MGLVFKLTEMKLCSPTSFRFGPTLLLASDRTDGLARAAAPALQREPAALYVSAGHHGLRSDLGTVEREGDDEQRQDQKRHEPGHSEKFSAVWLLLRA